MYNNNETNATKRINDIEELISIITKPIIFKSSDNASFYIIDNKVISLSDNEIGKTYASFELASKVVISKLYDMLRSGDIESIKSYIYAF